MKYCIRLASTKDQAALLSLMKAHAKFEGHTLEVTQHHQLLNKIEKLPVSIFVVASDNGLLGYMSCVKHFSTWDMDWYLYLDCLYLTEAMRGQGIGLKLMQKLRRFAKESEINTIQWQTPIDNYSAINFYQKLNAVNKEKQRFFWPV